MIVSFLTGWSHIYWTGITHAPWFINLEVWLLIFLWLGKRIYITEARLFAKSRRLGRFFEVLFTLMFTYNIYLVQLLIKTKNKAFLALSCLFHFIIFEFSSQNYRLLIDLIWNRKRDIAEIATAWSLSSIICAILLSNQLSFCFDSRI